MENCGVSYLPPPSEEFSRVGQTQDRPRRGKKGRIPKAPYLQAHLALGVPGARKHSRYICRYAPKKNPPTHKSMEESLQGPLAVDMLDVH
jgi:hypothetical protein